MLSRTIPGVVLALVTALAGQIPQEILDRDARQAELAAEAAARGPAAPIPLIGAGNRVMGAVYDQYFLGVVIGRAMIAEGKTPDPRAIQAHRLWQSRETVVVAYPIDCDGRPNQPTAIRWVIRLNAPVSPSISAGPVRGNQAREILPGVGLPDDALVVSMRNAIPVNPSIEVDYAGPVCRGAATTATFTISNSPGAIGRGINNMKLPPGLASLPSPSTVRISVTLDAAGRIRFPKQEQGPPELGPAAIAELTSKTYPPATANGVPAPMNILVPVVFTADGTPTNPAPFMPPTAGPGVMTTTSTMTMPSSSSIPPPSVPPAPAGFLDGQLARIAVEISAKGDPVPVPLDAAGPAVHGVLFDRFLVGAVKARAAFKAGTPMDPATVQPSLVQNDLIAVAYPVACSGRSIPVTDIRLSAGGTRPGPVRETSDVISGAALADRLPGVSLPSGSSGRSFASTAFSQNLEVRVAYAEACGSAASNLTFPIQWVRGVPQPRMTTTKLPAGSALSSPTVVQLRGMVDLDGAYRFPTIADGPPELGPIAGAMASQWKFQPYRANGVSSPLSVIMTLTFTTSGMPEPMPPPGTAPPSPTGPVGAAPPAMTSSTIGGRSSTDFTTPDEPGLTASTSKCEIAGDAGYGVTADGAIKVGGSFMEGPARARRYLTSLRGPAGQGLRVVRRGTTMASDKSTILDMYEITYAGLAAPIRVFVDQYHEEQILKAPQGLTCTAAR